MNAPTVTGHRVQIVYCQRCRFLLRAAWLAQEILFTLGDVIVELALVPGQGGVFEVRVDDRTIFSRRECGRFPEAAELKRMIRDFTVPERSLGHSDGTTGASE